MLTKSIPFFASSQDYVKKDLLGIFRSWVLLTKNFSGKVKKLIVAFLVIMLESLYILRKLIQTKIMQISTLKMRMRMFIPLLRTTALQRTVPMTAICYCLWLIIKNNEFVILTHFFLHNILSENRTVFHT